MSGATENTDGTRKPWKHGATIGRDGEVRLTSVSAMELASRCLRRWKFRYGPLKLQDPPGKDQERGNAGHAEIARYELTGDRSRLSPMVIAGLHQIPPPGPDLKVEYDIVPDLEDGRSGLAFAKLRAGGIPVVGAIDLIHERPENYGVSDITEMRDEPGIVKVVDWKFPNTLKNAKAGHELVETLQMAGYGKWLFEMFPSLERVRLAHGYFPMKGSPRLATAIATREQVEQTWKRADAIAVSMRDAAREPDPNKVDANTRDCRAFGRDCPAKVAGVCRAEELDTLAEYVGVTAAENLISAARLIRSPGETQMNPTLPQMPFQAPAAAPAPANTILAAMGAAPAPAAAPGPAPDVLAQMASLSAAVAPPPPAPPPGPQLTPQQQWLKDIIAQIESHGLGFPAIAGPLAAAYTELKQAEGHVGYQTGAPGYTGTGELAKYTIPDPNMLPAVLTEVQKAVAARGQQAPAQVQAPAQSAAPAAIDANPAATAQAQADLAAQQAKAEADAKAAKEAEKAAKKAAKEAEKAQKKAAEEAAKAAAQTQATVPATAPAQTDAPSAPVAAPAAPAAAPSSPVDSDNGTGRAINFYVDCVVDGIPTMSFWPIVEQACAILTQQSGCTDFRYVPDGNAFSHGKWEGALAGLLRQANIQGGNYAFDGAYGKIGSVVVETMREVVRRSGGVFVKGAR